MHFFRIIFVAVCGILTACAPSGDIDINSIDIDWKFERLDLKMYACSQAILADSTLDEFEAYQRFFFADRGYYLESLGLPDSRNGRTDSILALSLVGLVADSSMNHLLDTIQQVFPPSYPFDSLLQPIVKRLVAYFPDDTLEIPQFCTFANGFFTQGDSRSIDQIQVLPHYFGLGLHYFLGKDLLFYPALIPAYMRQRFDKKYIEVLVASSIAEGMVPEVDPRSQPTLLDHIIRKGVVQYFIDKLLPASDDSLKLFYSAEQMGWAETYEPAIYKELLPELYSTNYLQYRDYLEEKPFSSQFSEEAPPRLGQFLGWKMIRTYMKKNPSVSLAKLTENTAYEEIFKAAQYRP